MKILKFDNKDDWLEARLGKVTGTRLKDLVGSKSKPKIGFYEILAERIAIPSDGELAMDRGKRLEEEAIERFEKETGQKVDKSLVMWQREDDDNIAVSPDGFILNKKKKVTKAVEAKCLSSARHIEAWVNKTVPSDYEYQVFQYFIVNDDLQTLYFCFYDPRMPIDFFFIEVNRIGVQVQVDEYLELERTTLARLAELEKQLTF